MLPRWSALLYADVRAPSPHRTPLRVVVACSGLGRVQRGYEAFSRECYEALRGRPDLDVWLVRGPVRAMAAD